MQVVKKAFYRHKNIMKTFKLTTFCQLILSSGLLLMLAGFGVLASAVEPKQSYNLSDIENLLRTEIPSETAPNEALAHYQDIVQTGSEIYFMHCFYCHGGSLDGKGHLAQGINPQPTNFQDRGYQLPKNFLFERITTDSSDWLKAVMTWHGTLSETEVWQVIVFLYDYLGQVPPILNQEPAKTLTRLLKTVQLQRANMMGEELYQFRCAVCHGEEGAADGPAAEFLYPKPRDFSTGTFKYKTSPGELPPCDEDLFNTIKKGLNGTAMPGWAGLLSDEQIKSLIPVIKGLDTFGSWEDENGNGDTETHEPIRITAVEPINAQIPYSAESIAKGAIAFEKNCKACHGEEGRGNITSNRPLADDWGYRLWPRDLTKPWTWRVSNVSGNDDNSRDETVRNIYRRMSIGIFGTPMPAYRSTSHDPDPVSLENRWHIANYVYSLRNKSIPPGGTMIKGVKIEGALPTCSEVPVWNKAPGTTLRLVPNIIKEERLFTPLADAITVRVLYNAQEITFLLEVNDRTDSRPGEAICEILQDEFLELHSDAFAIQFPKATVFKMSPVVDKPLYYHGDVTQPTTIWYWNAGSIFPRVSSKSIIFDGFGLNKKLKPQQKNNRLIATGKWEKGRWRVLMKLPRNGKAFGDISFRENQLIPISFANWDGSNGEVGSKHTLTSWYWLILSSVSDENKEYASYK